MTIPEKPELKPTNCVWGVCCFHSETGTEGGFWAVQDIRGIRTAPAGKGSWTCYGLTILESGDWLTVYTPTSIQEWSRAGTGPESTPAVVWDGEIRLHEHPPFTEDAFGYWIHHDQEGVGRELWAEWFLRGYPCRLQKQSERWVVGACRASGEDLDVGACQGV